MGPLEIILEDDDGNFPEEPPVLDLSHTSNLVLEVSTEDLRYVKKICTEGFTTDLEARKPFIDRIKDGIKTLGLTLEKLDRPFEGACSIQHLVVLENAVEFQSKASSELLPADGPVKTRIIPEETEELLLRATRVRKHMNYQLVHQMEEFYDDFERMLLILAVVGTTVKKVYFDTRLSRPCSRFVNIENFVIDPDQTSLMQAPRYAEILRYTREELEELYLGNFYTRPSKEIVGEHSNNEVRQVILEQQGFSLQDDKNEIVEIVEMYVDLQLEIDGDVLSPYIVTFNNATGDILAIRRNWKESDTALRRKKVWHVNYQFVPYSGFYGLGYTHLLGSNQAALTAGWRAFIDSAQLSNMQGGIKSKNLRILGDNSGFEFGEFRDAEYQSNTSLAELIYPWQFKEPSQGLLQALQFLEERSQRFADTTKQVVADSTNYGPVGTTAALLEASAKFYTSIHKRIHRAFGRELKAIALLNHEYFDSLQKIEGLEVTEDDYDPSSVDVVPVSDPNISSHAQRLAMSQTKLQAAMQAPDIHDVKQAFKDFYLALGVENVEKLLPSKEPEPPKPQDPMQDIITVVQGRPIAAFPGQNHEAHIVFKQAWLQDPMNGGSQVMQQFAPQILNNIREHMMLDYQEKIAGVSKIENKAATTPEQMELVLAQAARKILEVHLRMQQENMGGDPAAKIAQAALIEAEAEKAKVAHKAATDLLNIGVKLEDIRVKEQKELNRAKESGTKLQQNKERLGIDLIKEGIRNQIEREKPKKNERKT